LKLWLCNLGLHCVAVYRLGRYANNRLARPPEHDNSALFGEALPEANLYDAVSAGFMLAM